MDERNPRNENDDVTGGSDVTRSNEEDLIGREGEEDEFEDVDEIDDEDDNDSEEDVE